MTYDPIDTSATDNAADGSVTTDTLDSATLNNSGTATTQDLVVNGTATGVGGVFAPVLEAGDTITVGTIDTEDDYGTFHTLYSGPARDVLGGVMVGTYGTDFKYTFSDNSTLQKNTGTGLGPGNVSRAQDTAEDKIEADFLPPALDVIKIEVLFNNIPGRLGAEVLLKN